MYSWYFKYICLVSKEVDVLMVKLVQLLLDKDTTLAFYPGHPIVYDDTVSIIQRYDVVFF